jgi:cell division protein ZapA (FtsZ GTPase activity inhibitor)
VTSIKILGKEYRIRGDADPAHLDEIAAYVDQVMQKVQHSTSDTQDAAILAALNIASELMRTRASKDEPLRRLRSLIDLVDSA